MKGVTILPAIAVFALTIGFVSCDVTSEKSLEESLEVIPSVQAITGAQNTTIAVTKGSSSYFEIDFSEVIPNEYIDNSKREAWCIAYNQPIRSDGDVYEGLSIYYAEGEKWQPIRRLLGAKDQLVKENPDITYKEIQVAIWSLLEFPKFDLDNITVDQIPSRMVTDGEFNFDKELARSLIEFSSSENGVSNKQVASKLRTDDTTDAEICVIYTDEETQTVIVPCMDTFWAYGEYSFRDESLEIFEDGQWGWIYVFRPDNENPSSTPLIAGAGEDDGTMTAEELQDYWVGSLNVELSGTTLAIVYEASGLNQFKEAHLWVGCDFTEELPVNDGGNVPPGELPFSYEPDDDDYFTSHIFELTIGSSDDYDNNQIKSCPNNEYQIAAHGVANWGN